MDPRPAVTRLPASSSGAGAAAAVRASSAVASTPAGRVVQRGGFDPSDIERIFNTPTAVIGSAPPLTADAMAMFGGTM